MRLFWGMGVGWLGCVLLGCSPNPPGFDGGTGGGAGGGGGGCGAAAQTPPNLVPNPGFECGDLGWSAQGLGTLAADPEARTGTQAAKLIALGSPAEGKFATTQPVVASASGKTYCAVAWLKGTVADAQLSVLEAANGGVIDHTFSTPVASATWLRTPPSIVLDVKAAAGAKLYLRVLMRTPKANDTLLVDDVDLWESADGTCKEAR